MEKQELVIVEGKSAAKAVESVCHQSQTVIAMQGKPRNPYKCTWRRVVGNCHYNSIIEALALKSVVCQGESETLEVSPAGLPFQKILLLFDPDADGIHCAALLLLFFRRVLPGLLQSGMIFQARPPLDLFTITCALASAQEAAVECPMPKPTGSRMLGYNDDHSARLAHELTRAGYTFTRKRFRGLASMDAQDLKSWCVDKVTRNQYPLSMDAADAAMRVFVGTQET